MKRQVKSQEDLRRLALASGASVDIAGSKFNTDMVRAQPSAAPVKKPADKSAEEPLKAEQKQTTVTEVVNVTLDTEPLAAAMDKGTERMAEVLGAVIKQLPIPANNSSPLSWTFKINRDTRGFIDTVEATPKTK